MAIAWSTVALLIALLPGFFFFFGIYVSENFTREVAKRGPLGTLAATVSVSFFVHALLWILIQQTCGGRGTIPIPGLKGGLALPAWLQSGVRCISSEAVLAVFQLEGASSKVGVSELANTLSRSTPHIALYVGLTTGLGGVFGYGYGKALAEGWLGLKRLASHGWVYELIPRDEDLATFAYVLTNIREENRLILYRGVLEDFGLQKDGRFAYLVIGDAQRSYMRLEEDEAAVDQAIHRIGQSSESDDLIPGTPESSRLMIEGEDIANAVFERLSTVQTKSGTDALDEAIAKKKKRGKKRSQTVPSAVEFQPTPLPKRLFDFAFALFQIVLTLPTWILITLAIKIEDGGQIFSKDRRIGKGGNIFYIWRFRTTRRGGGSTQLTRVGRFLRATALDELPQIWNILRGYMSFVGPRPLQPGLHLNEHEELVKTSELPHYRERQSVLPGVVGLGQLRAPRSSLKKQFRYDVLYVRNRSFSFDLRLLFQSFLISIRGMWLEIGQDEG